MSKQYYRKLNPESEFSGTTWGMIGLGLGQFFLTLLTLGFGAAYATVLGYRWFAKHTKLNGKQLIFEGSAWSLFGHFIKWGFLTVITLGIYGYCVPVRLEAWKISHTVLAEDDTSKMPFTACNMPHFTAPANVPAALPNAPAVQPVPYPHNPYVPVSVPTPYPSAPAAYPQAAPMPRPAPGPRPMPAPRPAPAPALQPRPTQQYRRSQY